MIVDSILELLKRDDLKAICRAAGLDVSDREKAAISERILWQTDGGPATLTKTDLIEAVAAEAALTKRDAEVMINAASRSANTHVLNRGGRRWPIGPWSHSATVRLHNLIHNASLAPRPMRLLGAA